MHSGAHAFCILMALAAVGSETVSASDPAAKLPASANGQYQVEAPFVDINDRSAEATALQSSTVSAAKSQPAYFAPLFSPAVATNALASYALPLKDKVMRTYDADSRKLADVASADECQLLFAKISRG